MIRVLFLCAQNRLRSPTAEAVFSNWSGMDCASAGLHESADVPLSVEQLAWADLIFVMEKTHRSKLGRRWKRHLNGKRVICLDVPDDYDYLQPELIALLMQRAGPHLRAKGARGPED